MVGMKTLNEFIEFTGHSNPPYRQRADKNRFFQPFDRFAFIPKSLL
jgi:hypothetical protein